MKSYTDIEQSKTLSKILPLESADMLWEQHGAEPYVTIKPWTTIGKSIGCHCLPCWSLAALIGSLPSFIKDSIGMEYSLTMYKEYIEYSNPNISSLYSAYIDATGNDNLVDACYELILKLHELKLL